jgi:hypothetical protein
MNPRFLSRASARAIVVIAMTCGVTFGVLGMTASIASASSGGSWYVSTKGTKNNACSSKKPCKTIAEALAVAAKAATGGTIHVAKGTYIAQITATTVDDNVTIEGASITGTVIEPPGTNLSWDTDTDSTTHQYYVVDVQPGAHGFDLKELTVNGSRAVNFFGGCGADYVGIYYHESSGVLTDVDVAGIDLPAGDYGCQDGLGIYANSTEADPSRVTMNTVSMTSPEVTANTQAALPANTYSATNLPVSSIPGTFVAGQHITIDGNGGSGGITATVASTSPPALSITGATQYNSPMGSIVDYTPYVGAYDKNGITCDDEWTTCNISNSTVQGEGPQNGIGQNGIQLYGNAAATLTNNHISGNSYTGESPSDITDEFFACGLLIINSGSLTLTGNVITANDTNIYASWDPSANDVSPPDVLPTLGPWTITGNTASDATDVGLAAGAYGWGVGLWLDGTTTDEPVDVYDNTLSSNGEVGLIMTGDDGADIGGGTAPDANTIESNQQGISVQGPSTQCYYGGGPCSSTADAGYASENNTFSENTVKDNTLGVVLWGANSPSGIPTQYNIDPGYDGSADNTFNGNTWSANTDANVLDFTGLGSSAIANQFGPSDPSSIPSNASDSCEPLPGGSYSANVFMNAADPGTAITVPLSTVDNGGTEAFTDTSSGFSAFASGPTSYVADSLGFIPNATTVSSIAGDGDSLTMSAPAKASSGNDADTLSQGQFWAC